MDFEVNRQDFSETRLLDNDRVALAPGQVRLGIERFAVTTNNITYAVAGDFLDYWGFFPASAPWGRIPAMGLSSVIESANPDISVGGRYFGFSSMSDELVIDAVSRRNGFRDTGNHRAKHAVAYTDFVDVNEDIMFRDHQADEYLLFRGLFTTSFLADDFLADNDFHGATQTLVTSASSKTSISLAACLAARGHHSVGLTSSRNLAFVEGLGLYDQVITYDQIADLDASTPSVLVDMAGSATARSAVHNHFGANLRFSSMIGATHRDDPAGAVADLPGPTPEFFFAPTQIAKRSEEWGSAELTNRIAASLHRLLDDMPRWLTVNRHAGPDGMTKVYQELLGGNADPAIGYVVSLQPDGFEQA